jgi:hypothetical protein
MLSSKVPSGKNGSDPFVMVARQSSTGASRRAAMVEKGWG